MSQLPGQGLHLRLQIPGGRPVFAAARQLMRLADDEVGPVMIGLRLLQLYQAADRPVPADPHGARRHSRRGSAA